MSAVGVVVRHVGVAGELGEDLDVGLDALEAVFDVVALFGGCIVGGGGGFALVVAGERGGGSGEGGGGV